MYMCIKLANPTIYAEKVCICLICVSVVTYTHIPIGIHVYYRAMEPPYFHCMWAIATVRLTMEASNWIQMYYEVTAFARAFSLFRIDPQRHTHISRNSAVGRWRAGQIICWLLLLLLVISSKPYSQCHLNTNLSLSLSLCIVYELSLIESRYSLVN